MYQLTCADPEREGNSDSLPPENYKAIGLLGNTGPDPP